MAKNGKEPNRITGITVRGFKSLADETHVAIKPLTILAGANSSGKSSIMQPLLLMKQTLEAASDPGALLLNGDHVQFSSADQLLSISPRGEESDGFSIKIETGIDSSFAVTFLRDKEHGYDVGEMHYRFGKTEFTLKRGMSQKAIDKVIPTELKTILRAIAREDQKPRWEVTRHRCFLMFKFTGVEERFRFAPMPISDGIADRLESIIHLPGLRGNPQRTYPKTTVGESFQGTFEPYVASLIHSWQSGKTDQLATLGSALEDLGLTWTIRADRVDDTQIRLRVGRLVHARRGGAQDLVSIADVGFGVSQVLPVLVALIQAKPRQLVYLEQPEIHLHPLAQRKLAGLLANAAKRGVVLVVETHSNLLLREVQTLMAKGDLTPDQVALHWFERDEQGCTKVTTAELDENGAYGMEWPADFDRVELDSEGAYLDAVEFRKP